MSKRLWEGFRLVNVIVLVFALFLTLESPVVAAQESDSTPLGVVTTLFADWNLGDLKAMKKLFVAEPSVTDVFPRFYWHGTSAFKNWMSDLDKSNVIEGFTDYDFEPGTPTTNDIEGARAIVILPVVINLKQHGQPASFPGLVNIVLRRTGASWKILVFTWSST
jgi:hypothetical protein